MLGLGELCICINPLFTCSCNYNCVTVNKLYPAFLHLFGYNWCLQMTSEVWIVTLCHVEQTSFITCSSNSPLQYKREVLSCFLQKSVNTSMQCLALELNCKDVYTVLLIAGLSRDIDKHPLLLP